MIIFYLSALVFLTVFSFGFVDANFPIKIWSGIFAVVHDHRQLATIIYVFLMIVLFWFYVWLLGRAEKNMVDGRAVWRLIGMTCLALFFSFPAFSYDMFNYIATAKVAFLYKENPYLVMPIEIPNEPMLSFLHAANKVALYGPTWIGLTFLPHVLGFGNLLVTLYAFKALLVAFYLGLSWLIWRMSGKNTRALAFFALNPIVITETLVSGHNDVAMMCLALAGFFMVKNKRFLLGLFLFVLSAFVKGATIVLVPLFLVLWLRMRRGKSVSWAGVWKWGAMLLLGTFFVTPLREELYPWYFMWPLTFIALLPKKHFLQFLSHGFSFGLPLRFAPFVYFGDWGGVVPLVKNLVSAVPVIVSSSLYGIKKNH